MECFRNFYGDKTSVLSHLYFAWPWVSHFSLTVLPLLCLHLFILLAFSLIMCTDSQIVNWLFDVTFIQMIITVTAINISGVWFWVYRKKGNTSILVSLPERNRLEAKCLLSLVNICILLRFEQGQGDIICIKAELVFFMAWHTVSEMILFCESYCSRIPAVFHFSLRVVGHWQQSHFLFKALVHIQPKKLN